MYKSCPCCCAEKSSAFATEISGVLRCVCGAIYGECNSKEAAKIYKSEWYTGKCKCPEYVDLFIDGKNRFHGWVEPYSRKIVQVG
jgi:hypothetical protein